MRKLLAGALACAAAVLCCFGGGGEPMRERAAAVQDGEGKAPRIAVRVLDAAGRLSAPQLQPKVVRSEEEWRKRLTPEQYRVTRTQGTERAFCGAFFDHKKDGWYACVGCGLPLFASKAKFDSGTGWPSFFEPVAAENVAERRDAGHGMERVEILCARCDAHLGHVFEDGPRPTGLRYCLNSAALVFSEAPPREEEPPKDAPPLEKASFGAG